MAFVIYFSRHYAANTGIPSIKSCGCAIREGGFGGSAFSCETGSANNAIDLAQLFCSGFFGRWLRHLLGERISDSPLQEDGNDSGQATKRVCRPLSIENSPAGHVLLGFAIRGLPRPFFGEGARRVDLSVRQSPMPPLPSDEGFRRGSVYDSTFSDMLGFFPKPSCLC